MFLPIKSGTHSTFSHYMSSIGQTRNEEEMKIAPHIMRTSFFIALLLLFAGNTILANTSPWTDSIKALTREVTELFKKNQRDFPDIQDQQVIVEFMINAKNEIVVLDVTGESPIACEYVKKVLSYKKVKYNPSSQLTSFSVRINLVKEK